MDEYLDLDAHITCRFDFKSSKITQVIYIFSCNCDLSPVTVTIRKKSEVLNQFLTRKFPLQNEEKLIRSDLLGRFLW